MGQGPGSRAGEGQGCLSRSGSRLGSGKGQGRRSWLGSRGWNRGGGQSGLVGEV